MICSNKHDGHGGPVDDAFDERKKNTHVVTNAPAATPAPVANSVCFEHSHRTTHYQPDVVTCDFNVDIAASMMDNGVYREGLGDETNARRTVTIREPTVDSF